MEKKSKLKINVQDMSLLAQANYKKVLDGRDAYRKFQQMSMDPVKYNEELLLKILDDNRDTEYERNMVSRVSHRSRSFRPVFPYLFMMIMPVTS